MTKKYSLQKTGLKATESVAAPSIGYIVVYLLNKKFNLGLDEMATVYCVIAINTCYYTIKNIVKNKYPNLFGGV
jgi:hypothetical protein